VRSATGLAILRAIVADERDPGRLSMLKNNYVRASRQKNAQSLIDQSLQGDLWRTAVRPGAQFGALRHYLVRIAACDKRVEAHPNNDGVHLFFLDARY